MNSGRSGSMLIGPAAALLAIVVVSFPSRAEIPYDLDTGREIALYGTGAAMLGGARLADAGLDTLTLAEIVALDRMDLSGLDRSATCNWSPGADTASDILVHAAMAAPLTLMLNEPGKSAAGTVAVMYTQTLLLEAGAVQLIKNLVRRPRPFTYNDDPRIDPALARTHGAVRSFPSGHTASAFASMVFMASAYERMHPDSDGRAWMWGGCLAVAGTTGYLRYAAGRHFPTDILAGAAIGTLAGWLVPKLHENDLTGPGGGGGGAPVFIGYSGSF